jgi:hypothetical protein
MAFELTADWLSEQQQWLERHREKSKSGPDVGKLVSDRARQYLSGARDKPIKNPGLFIKDLYVVLRDLQSVKHGSAERLKHELIELINEMQSKAHKGEVILPTSFQNKALMDASEFDRTGIITEKLINAFNEKYEGVRRIVKAASFLRKLASVLQKLTTQV